MGSYLSVELGIGCDGRPTLWRWSTSRYEVDPGSGTRFQAWQKLDRRDTFLGKAQIWGTSRRLLHFVENVLLHSG
jgi:hypothetical protein